MSIRPIFIHSKDYFMYHFHREHPFNQYRLQVTKDLLKSLGHLATSQIVPPRMATDEELALIHEPSFIQAVKQASKEQVQSDLMPNYSQFGLNTEDTPIFPNMHQAASLIVGGSILGAELIMQNKANHVLHLGGGLHHSFRGQASGFCIYNDCSVAIAYLRKNYKLKVLYIDTDAHHGDGVQWAFYDEPEVFTFSIHETGRYLFPGTGNITERGDGQGYGFTLNLPLDAYTEDESWLSSFEQGLEVVLEFFQPDIIISQHGCDAHYYDPLTHLSCSMKIYAQIPKLIKQAAEQYCQGRWLALGGGGYDIYRVVPRAWSLLWMAMNNLSIKQQKLPVSWLDKYSQETNIALPEYLFDDEETVPHIPRKRDIEEKNQQTVKKALHYLKSM